MAGHPIPIERPIIITDDGRAVLAMDPAAVRSALDTA
jgi:hypothetical protein